MSATASMGSWWWRVRRQWDRLSTYLPLVLMAALALFSYWLVRNSPALLEPVAQTAPSHVPDYFMRDFTVRVFDGEGRLKSELQGQEGRHYPDTDTVEVDRVRVRLYNAQGRLTTARAERGLTNADGSEVQLFGQAVIVREAYTTATGEQQPRQELRSEFLHLFTDTEQIQSHRPVEFLRGTQDRFTADRLHYDNLAGVLALDGRVRGVIHPRSPRPKDRAAP